MFRRFWDWLHDREPQEVRDKRALEIQKEYEEWANEKPDPPKGSYERDSEGNLYYKRNEEKQKE